MSKAIQSRHSSHRWCTKTRCKIVETNLTTIAQEQSRKLLMHCHVICHLQMCLCSNKLVIF